MLAGCLETLKSPYNIKISGQLTSKNSLALFLSLSLLFIDLSIGDVMFSMFPRCSEDLCQLSLFVGLHVYTFVIMFSDQIHG